MHCRSVAEEPARQLRAGQCSFPDCSKITLPGAGVLYSPGERPANGEASLTTIKRCGPLARRKVLSSEGGR